MLRAPGPGDCRDLGGCLLLNGDERGFAFANSMVLDDFSYFFFFLFAGDRGRDHPLLAGLREALRVTTRPSSTRSSSSPAAAMMLLASSRDLILIFVALELTSISQYIMAALQRDERSTEAGYEVPAPRARPRPR